MFSLRLIAAGVVAATLATAPAAHASTLYYGGDPFVDQFGYYWLALSDNAPGFNIQNYDAFTVPTGHTWSVSGLFQQMAVFGSNHTVTSARWEIRSGLSNLSLGTLVASGSVAPTTSPSGYTSVSGLFGELMTLSLPTPVTLTGGSYWLLIQPGMPAGDYHTDVAGTQNVNAIGTGQDGSFITYANGHYNGTNPNDLSQGLTGSDTPPAPVPEGPTFALFLASLLFGGLLRRRSQR